jgi:hypothetical protein
MNVSLHIAVNRVRSPGQLFTIDLLDVGIQAALRKSVTVVFQMLLCGECYENVYT